MAAEMFARGEAVSAKPRPAPRAPNTAQVYHLNRTMPRAFHRKTQWQICGEPTDLTVDSLIAGTAVWSSHASVRPELARRVRGERGGFWILLIQQAIPRRCSEVWRTLAPIFANRAPRAVLPDGRPPERLARIKKPGSEAG